MEWINETGIAIDSTKDDLLGFIYRIDMEDGYYYFGRKQFWAKRGREWYESDWKEYRSSSNTILRDPKSILQKSILAVFQSKSAIRYAEALAIILSGAYEDGDRGVNWSFAGCKGTLKLSEQDRIQLQRLREMCNIWRRVDGRLHSGFSEEKIKRQVTGRADKVQLHNGKERSNPY